MQVEHGVRFELRLAAETPRQARFELTVRVPSAAWSGRAEIVGEAGAVRFDFPSSEPPGWCLGIVRASLRALFRERPARGGYPARVTRWRPEPITREGEAS